MGTLSLTHPTVESAQLLTHYFVSWAGHQTIAWFSSVSYSCSGRAKKFQQLRGDRHFPGPDHHRVLVGSAPTNDQGTHLTPLPTPNTPPRNTPLSPSREGECRWGSADLL